MNKVDNFLQHYASQYYDPAKAHDYYMKHRKLKGRTTQSMSDKQKEAWTYARDQIGSEKKAKIASQKQTTDKAVQQLQQRATALRDQITARLQTLSASLSKQEKESERLKASAEREKVRSELKTAIANAREAYKSAKTKLDADYESKYQKEYDNILSKIPGKKVRTRKKKK
jgi:exonuclease VII large subunit